MHWYSVLPLHDKTAQELGWHPLGLVQPLGVLNNKGPARRITPGGIVPHDRSAVTDGNTAVHCPLSQNGVEHVECTEDITLHPRAESAESPAGKETNNERIPESKASPKQLNSEGETTRPGHVKLTKPVALWTQQDVCKWLKKHCPNQYQVYSEAFKQHDITGFAAGGLPYMQLHLTFSCWSGSSLSPDSVQLGRTEPP
ncbi:SAM12 protein, partial [Polypterus senegalus]